MSKKFWIKALAAVATAGAVIFPFAPPADAAYACKSGQTCFYYNSNDTGSVYLAAGLTNDGDSVWDFWNRHYTNGVNANDSVSSIVNNTPFALFVFTDGYGNGPYFVVNPGENVVGLTWVEVHHAEHDRDSGVCAWELDKRSFNDVISSASLHKPDFHPAPPANC
ncbi:peptidase inhibitor family I36 protein [Cryptosporangium phraense]|nr:peptidase inhibitor family I36 protein [Cryptosporangium phraense]